MESWFVITGYGFGGIFCGAIIAWLMFPVLWQRENLAARSQAIREIISFVVFGSGIGGGFAFKWVYGPNAQTLWASHLIGLAVAFLGVIIFLIRHNRMFASRVRRLPPNQLRPLQILLFNGPNQDNGQSIRRIEAALDALADETSTALDDVEGLNEKKEDDSASPASD